MEDAYRAVTLIDAKYPDLKKTAPVTADALSGTMIGYGLKRMEKGERDYRSSLRLGFRIYSKQRKIKPNLRLR